MGIDAKEFVKAFLIALKDEDVIEKLDESLCGPIRFELNKLSDASTTLNQEMNSSRELNSQLQKEVAPLREIEQKKDDKIKELETKIITLEQKCDKQEQYSRRNSLRITGIKEDEHENVTDKVMDLINDKLQLSGGISIDHVDRAHRTGKKESGQSRAILIKFATYRARQTIYQKRCLLNPKKREGETAAVDKSGSTTPIFINEDLTRTRSHLLYKARCLKRDGKLEDCWSSDGTILIKDNANKIFPISNITQLESIVNP